MKIMKFLSGGAVISLVSLLFMSMSCEEQNGPVLQPDEQKQVLEEVAIEMLEKCPASEMEEYVDLYNNFYREYLEDETYDFSAFEDFGDKAFNDSFENNDDSWYDEVKDEYFRTSVVNAAIVLSNHKGEFTFGSNAVIKDNSTYDGVKVTMPLGSKTYTAELKQSGKVTKATYNYIDKGRDEYRGSYYDENKGEWVEYSAYNFEDNVTFTIDVPEKIEIGLYEDGKYVAKVTITMTMNFSAAGLNPAVDNFNANVKVEMNNGYEIAVDKVAFDGTKKQAGSAVKVSKDGSLLLSAAASGDVEIVNSTYKYEGDSYSYEYTTVELKKAKNISAEIDVLGRVQIKGSCSNAKEASEAMESYYDALRSWDDETGNEKTPDEVEALRHLANLNAKINFGVYYEGNPQQQATLLFEMDKEIEDEQWDRNGDGVITSEDAYVYYGLLPVIVFGDGSRYTFEGFFEDSFDTFFEELEAFEDDYEDLIGTIVEEKEPVYEELH